MEWIVKASCSLCNEEEEFEVSGNRPPYLVGDLIDSCACGGKMVVDEILEI
ncbi:MAG: hypothetical protein KO217_00365 [Methanobacteriaceae archaeon]|jgi:uncharacterized protein (DUF983 family)|nr:hypothetical protein [Methanobacteriaceae archaeon]